MRYLQKLYAEYILRLLDLVDSVYRTEEVDVPEPLVSIRLGTEKYLENRRYKENKYLPYISYFIVRSTVQGKNVCANPLCNEPTDVEYCLYCYESKDMVENFNKGANNE